MRYLIASLLLLAAITVPVRAADFDYDKERLKLWEWLADKHADLGDDWKAALIHTQARKQYDRARELEPNNRKAWKGLGYKEKGGEWVADVLLPEKDAVHGAEYLEALKKPAEKKKETWTKCADRCRKLMEAATKAGDTRGARIAAVDLIYYTPDDSAARKLRGFERVGEDWVPSFAKVWRDEGVKIVGDSTFGEEMTEEDEDAKTIGSKFYRRGSKHLVARTSIDDNRAKFLHRSAEATITRAMALLGKEGSPFGMHKYTILHLQNGEEFEAMLKKVLKLEGDELKFGLQLSGYGQAKPYGYMTWANTEGSADDMLCNTVALRVLAHAQDGIADRASWVDTGWGYFVTSHTLGTTQTQRYTLKEVGATTTGEPIIPEFTKKAGTPELLREVALYGIRHDRDIPFEQLVATEINDMQLAHAAKSFSFIEFIYATQIEQARKWLKDGGRKTPAERIKQLEDCFGKPLADLEATWREWVLLNY